MLRILSAASLRLSALIIRCSSTSPNSVDVQCRPRFHSSSGSTSPSKLPAPIAPKSSSAFPVASSYVNIIPVASSNNYTIAILSDKPGLLKLKDQLLSSSLRAIQFLPQLKHSSAEVKGAFLVWYVYLIILNERLKLTRRYLEFLLAQAHTATICIAQPVYFKGINKLASENTLEAFISSLTRGNLPTDAIAIT
jgi:hypothetical protein